MRIVGLYAFVLSMCLSCVKADSPARRAVKSVYAVSHVTILTRPVHAGGYATWELRLWRVESGESWETSEVYLTSVATGAPELSVYYKRIPDSGVEYVAIDELKAFFAVEPGNRARSIAQDEYMSANAEPIKLSVLHRESSVQVDTMQYPLTSSEHSKGDIPE